VYRVEIHPKAKEFLEQLPRKLQEHTRDTLLTLREEPRPRGSELLTLPDNYRVYRLHIARVLTVFYQVYDDEHRVRILKIMTIEQAHKEYRRWG
jgi:mRNA interferase RelE/StbE